MSDWLNEIRERARKATKGPWSWWTSNSFRRLSSDPSGKDGDVLSAVAHKSDGQTDIVGSYEDREFIAHARVDIPKLLEVATKADVLLQALDEFRASGTCPGCGAREEERELRLAFESKDVKGPKL